MCGDEGGGQNIQAVREEEILLDICDHIIKVIILKILILVEFATPLVTIATVSVV